METELGRSLECVIGEGRHFYRLFGQIYVLWKYEPAPPTNHAHACSTRQAENSTVICSFCSGYPALDTSSTTRAATEYAITACNQGKLSVP